MGWSFRCPKTELTEWFDGPGKHECPFCHKKHEAQETGAPPKEPGFGRPPPRFKRHYSPVHGRRLTSWSEYHKANRELGIIYTGEQPSKDRYGTTRTTSAPGLKPR